MARIVHLEECNSFLIGIIESFYEMLRCKVPCSLSFSLSFHLCCLILFVISGTCLDFVGEAHRVSEQITALEKASEGIDSLWSDPRRRRAIVLLQDRAQHIGEAVDGCQRS
jgi:hypothetical protein